MRCAWYERKGPAVDVLQVGEQPAPHPGPGEVLVAVRASGINPSDTKGRSGARGNTAMPYPLIIPHQDGAGIVEAVGEGVPESRVGERVWLYEAQLGRPFGTAAQYVALPARNAVPMPEGLGFVEAAALGVPALTAHRCVFADGPVAGKTVLVTGGAGAVGFYAIQFARQGGARVVATVSGDAQAELARSAGAEFVIDRHAGNVVAEAAALLGAEGERSVDRIVEVAFGANLTASLRMLKPNGTIAAYVGRGAGAGPALLAARLPGCDCTLRARIRDDPRSARRGDRLRRPRRLGRLAQAQYRRRPAARPHRRGPRPRRTRPRPR
ncbi:MAG TPA: NADPH:quinone reductase [Allosphingosinicella sp.]